MKPLVGLYRVSQKKRNGEFSVHCELKVLYIFTALDGTSSAKENDAFIWSFWFYDHFLKYGNFQISLEFCDGSAVNCGGTNLQFHIVFLWRSVDPWQQKKHGTMHAWASIGRRMDCLSRQNYSLIRPKNPAKFENYRIFKKMVIESKLLNQIECSRSIILFCGIIYALSDVKIFNTFSSHCIYWKSRFRYSELDNFENVAYICIGHNVSLVFQKKKTRIWNYWNSFVNLWCMPAWAYIGGRVLFRAASRPLNFYSYDIFFPRACARDHSPRRNYNNAKQPMHWTDSRHGRAV